MCQCEFQQRDILHGRGMRVFIFVIGCNDCRKINLHSINLFHQNSSTFHFDEEGFDSGLIPQSCSLCGGKRIHVYDNLIKGEHVCPQCQKNSLRFKLEGDWD